MMIDTNRIILLHVWFGTALTWHIGIMNSIRVLYVKQLAIHMLLMHHLDKLLI